MRSVCECVCDWVSEYISLFSATNQHPVHGDNGQRDHTESSKPEGEKEKPLVQQTVKTFNSQLEQFADDIANVNSCGMLPKSSQRSHEAKERKTLAYHLPSKSFTLTYYQC